MWDVQPRKKKCLSNLVCLCNICRNRTENLGYPSVPPGTSRHLFPAISSPAPRCSCLNCIHTETFVIFSAVSLLTCVCACVYLIKPQTKQHFRGKSTGMRSLLLLRPCVHVSALILSDLQTKIWRWAFWRPDRNSLALCSTNKSLYTEPTQIYVYLSCTNYQFMCCRPSYERASYLQIWRITDKICPQYGGTRNMLKILFCRPSYEHTSYLQIWRITDKIMNWPLIYKYGV